MYDVKIAARFNIELRNKLRSIDRNILYYIVECTLHESGKQIREMNVYD